MEGGSIVTVICCPPPTPPPHEASNAATVRSNVRKIAQRIGCLIFRSGVASTNNLGWVSDSDSCFESLTASTPAKDARQFPPRSRGLLSHFQSIQVAPVGAGADFDDDRHRQFVDAFHFFLDYFFQLGAL